MKRNWVKYWVSFSICPNVSVSPPGSMTRGAHCLQFQIQMKTFSVSFKEYKLNEWMNSASPSILMRMMPQTLNPSPSQPVRNYSNKELTSAAMFKHWHWQACPGIDLYTKVWADIVGTSWPSYWPRFVAENLEYSFSILEHHCKAHFNVLLSSNYI